jgi:hypothetical protein
LAQFGSRDEVEMAVLAGEAAGAVGLRGSLMAGLEYKLPTPHEFIV